MKNNYFLTFFFVTLVALIDNSLCAMEKSTAKITIDVMRKHSATNTLNTRKSTISIAVNPKNKNQLAIARHVEINGKHENEIGIFDLKTKKYTKEKNVLHPDIKHKLTKVKFNEEGKIIPIYFGNNTYTYNANTKKHDEKKITSEYKKLEVKTDTDQETKKISIKQNSDNSNLVSVKTQTQKHYSIFAVNQNKKYVAFYNPLRSEIDIYQASSNKLCCIINDEICGKISSLAYVDDNTLVIGYENDTKINICTLDQKTPELFLENTKSRSVHILYEKPKEAFWTWNKVKLFSGVFITAATLLLCYNKYFA